MAVTVGGKVDVHGAWKQIKDEILSFHGLFVPRPPVASPGKLKSQAVPSWNWPQLWLL